VRAAESLVAAAPPERREVFRRVVVRLIAPAPAASAELPRRARLTPSELDPGDADAVRELESAGVVETDPEGSDGAVRLASEWLCTAWLRARQWVDGDRDFLAWLHGLQPVVAAFRRQRRGSGEEPVLLRDAPLREADEWLQKRRAQLTAGERDLVEASLAQEKTELVEAARRVGAGWTDEERAQARRVLPRLVRVAPSHALDAADAPATVPLDELRASAADPVDDLVAARVLVKVADGAAGGVAVRLARPELMAEWAELKEWVDADRAFLRWQDELRLNEAQWRAERSSEERLLHGDALARVDSWRSRVADLPPGLRFYVEASEELRDRERVRDAERCVSLLPGDVCDRVRQVLMRVAGADGLAAGFAAGELEGESLRAALERLRELGVLALEVKEADGSTVVRLASPALLTRWPRMADWMAAERDARMPPTRSAGRRHASTTSASDPRRLPWRFPIVRARTLASAASVVVAGVLLASLLMSPGGMRSAETPESLNEQGLVALREANYGTARTAFAGAAERDPSYVPAYVGLATTLIQTREYAEAHQVLARADRLTHGRSSSVRAVAVRLACDEGDYAGAVAAAQRIPADSMTAGTYTWLAKAHQELGEQEAADDALDRALRLDPGYEPAQRMRRARRSPVSADTPQLGGAGTTTADDSGFSSAKQ
jgi:Tetratricopeptide repeat